MPGIITVTGATGHIGKTIAEHLLDSDVKVRTISRNAKNFSTLASKGAEIKIGNLEDSSFLIDSLNGSDAVFAMIPPLYYLEGYKIVLNRIAANLTQAIKINKIKHVVALSSIGADLPSGTGQILALHEFELMLKSIPETSVVVLRPVYFMENNLSLIPMIKNSGIIASYIKPDLKFGMIATKDIADVAVQYLLNPDFEGFTVRTLLGPRDYTYPEVASVLGSAIDKPDLTYVQLSKEDFSSKLISSGFSTDAADAIVEGFTALNEKIIQPPRNEFNTTPTTIEQFAYEIFALNFVPNRV